MFDFLGECMYNRMRMKNVGKVENDMVYSTTPHWSPIGTLHNADHH